MKKLLLSLLTIGLVGGVAFAASQAFFSDTETSTGNIFQAGDIDLKIDNTSYALDYNIPNYPSPIGAFVASTNNTWTLRDLTVERFFNFVDLKPGDYGEDTISVHVGSNPAWLCAAARITTDADNTITEPEDEDGDNGTDQNGELDENLNFVFWVDDGDNVLETEEVGKIFLRGPLSDIGQVGKITLADSSHSILGGTNPIPGDTDFFIGKAWCFGDLTATTETAEDPSDVGTPLTRGTGIGCNPFPTNNQAQTDSVVGDLQFYAVQARNNTTFTCAQNYTPTWRTITRVDRTQAGFGDGGWAGWSCPAGTTAIGGGIDSNTNPVGPNGVAAPSAPAVGGFNYPTYPHYTFGSGETGYVVQDFPGDGLGNTISFHIDCQTN